VRRAAERQAVGDAAITATGAGAGLDSASG